MQGLLAVPAVTGQLLQIFIGQPLAHYMATRVDAWNEKQAKLPVVAASQQQELVVDASTASEAAGKKNDVASSGKDTSR